MLEVELELEIEDKEIDIDIGEVQRVISSKHDELLNRDLIDQHPISAITGLNDALDSINTKIEEINNTFETRVKDIFDKIIEEELEGEY